MNILRAEQYTLWTYYAPKSIHYEHTTRRTVYIMNILRAEQYTLWTYLCPEQYTLWTYYAPNSIHYEHTCAPNSMYYVLWTSLFMSWTVYIINILMMCWTICVINIPIMRWTACIMNILIRWMLYIMKICILRWTLYIMNILIMFSFACYFRPVRSSCLFLSVALVYVKIIPGDWLRT